MYLLHVALSLGLISLTFCLALYIWGLRNIGNGSGLAKLFGFLIVITAIVATVCVGYCGVKQWQVGGCPVSRMTSQDITATKTGDATTDTSVTTEKTSTDSDKKSR